MQMLKETADTSQVTWESILTPEQHHQFDADGYVCVRQLLKPEEISEIRETFMKANENGPVEGLSEIRRDDTASKGYDAADPLAFHPRMMHPHRHPGTPVGEVAMKYMLDRRIGRVLAELLGEEPFAVQSMFYFKPPGARGQDLHQDNFYLRVKPGTCMAAWVAVDDADAENGGMMCVPRTQDLDIACPEKSDPKLYFTSDHVEPPAGKKPVMQNLKAGDVLFFNGSVIHGSTPNTSKTRFRRSFICHYVPGSTREMSHWYTEPLSFDGRAHRIEHNNDGGPCGTAQDAPAPH